MDKTMLLETADKLEKAILAGSPKKRLELQPELHKIVEDMVAHGVHVPPRIRDLNTVLLDESIEDRFDNMPV